MSAGLLIANAMQADAATLKAVLDDEAMLAKAAAKYGTTVERARYYINAEIQAKLG